MTQIRMSKGGRKIKGNEKINRQIIDIMKRKRTGGRRGETHGEVKGETLGGRRGETTRGMKRETTREMSGGTRGKKIGETTRETNVGTTEETNVEMKEKTRGGTTGETKRKTNQWQDLEEILTVSRSRTQPPKHPSSNLQTSKWTTCPHTSTSNQTAT